MISITITDPNKTDVGELRAVADLLLTFANRGETSVHPNSIYPALHADDDPAKGAPSPSEVFARTEVKAADVFKASAVPNPPAAVTSIAAAEAFSTAPAAQPDISTAATTALLPPAPLAAQSPAVAAPPTANLAATVKLDADGLPWDARIHSSGASINSGDGRWKKKRGIDETLVATVEEELRAVMEIPSSPPVGAVPPPPAQFAVAPPPPPPTPGAVTFPQFLPKVTQAMGSGALTQARVLEVLNAHGIPALPLLVNRPDLVAAIDAMLFPV